MEKEDLEKHQNLLPLLKKNLKSNPNKKTGDQITGLFYENKINYLPPRIFPRMLPKPPPPCCWFPLPPSTLPNISFNGFPDD